MYLQLTKDEEKIDRFRLSERYFLIVGIICTRNIKITMTLSVLRI